jgi:hypothetical protein
VVNLSPAVLCCPGPDPSVPFRTTPRNWGRNFKFKLKPLAQAEAPVPSLETCQPPGPWCVPLYVHRAEHNGCGWCSTGNGGSCVGVAGTAASKCAAKGNFVWSRTNCAAVKQCASIKKYVRAQLPAHTGPTIPPPPPQQHWHPLIVP